MANFGSETVKSSKGAVTIGTEAKRVEGGWRLNGVKSFGCNTGVADWYLVTAKLEGAETAEGIVTFLVRSDTKGVRERHQWKAIGMRATATHGIILENAFVPDEERRLVRDLLRDAPLRVHLDAPGAHDAVVAAGDDDAAGASRL